MIGFVAALLVTLGATGTVLPTLRWLVIDMPNHRSSHRAPTPRGGGLGVVVGVAVAMGAIYAVGRPTAWSVVLPAVALALVGFWDDLRSLPGALRLAVQFAAAGALVLLLAQGEPSPPAVLALVLAAVACVGYVNAFNFMDGVNGISATNAAVGGAWFAFLGHRAEDGALVGLGLVLAGAALGFLPWNAPRARIFLGDVGSYGLGMLLAGGATLAWVGGEFFYLSAAPLVVYLADTGWVLVKRARGGRPLMQPHREHVYQRLVDGGWSHGQVALLTAGLAALVCLLMTAAEDYLVPAIGGAALAVAAYLALPRICLAPAGKTS